MDLAPGRFYVGLFLCVLVVLIILLWTIDALRFIVRRKRRQIERKGLFERLRSTDIGLQTVVTGVE
jgi:hypothetical protein